MSEDHGQFGAQLRARRQAALLSQEELAERSGLNVRTIRNLERGQARWPHPHTLHRLADGLELRDAVRAEFVTAPGRRLACRDAVAQSAAPAPKEDLGVPRQVPAVVRHFVGRGAELGFLTGLLDGPVLPDGAGVVCVVGGMAGVGKSALVVAWAHQQVGRFPDGQLYADLEGCDAGRAPVGAGVVLGRFLEALGVPPDRVPADVEGRAGLYRSVLAGRRVLVVLDNARDGGQVRPLLPAAAGCMTVVTSRGRLADLVALEGAVPVTVGLLSTGEARDLLAGRLGAGRVAGERAAVEELIGLCGHLPLALGVAAAQVAGRPLVPLGVLVARLRGAGRLDVLSVGAGRADVRAALSWSYQGLSGPAARMFRLLGVHPGPDISSPAAASLAALDPAQTHRVLDELAGAHLVTETAPGRYALPGLLRAHAAELPAAGGDPRERRAALHRVLDHYLHTGHAAFALVPAVCTLAPPALAMPAAGMTRENMTAADQATAWFAAEHQVLIAAASAAADGYDAHALGLPLLLRPYLCRAGRWHTSIATGQLALAAARPLGDLAGQGDVLCHLGAACRSLGNVAEAAEHLRHGLTLFQRIEHPCGQAVAHTEICALRYHQGRDTDALYHAGQALAQYRIAGDRPGEANGLSNVGCCHVLLGDPVKGLYFLEQAVAMLRESGDRMGLAYALDSMGYAHHRLGEHKDAIHCYTDAASLSAELGVQPLHATVLDHLGDAHHRTAQTRAARRAWHQALDICSGLDHHDTTGLRAKLAGQRLTA